LRYFNVFGPRQRPDSPYAAAIPIFIHRMMSSLPPVVYGDGNQQRDFIYVEDVVRANLLAAEAPGAPGKVFNVCTGVSTSILELLERLEPYFPQAPEIEFSRPRPGDIYLSLGDPARAAKWLNFRAQISLEEGLAKTVEWMRP
jgi:UDP-glucose 4-epimerase